MCMFCVKYIPWPGEGGSIGGMFGGRLPSGDYHNFEYLSHGVLIFTSGV